ncbi:MAG: hypothetical protein ISR62_00705 [Desulfobacteraceae bacterium]|nr:hypothetical protein [Desulfobacterales bacterium]MBL6966929.1 hypothetical protein [Desulfobacteraceae bacterium]MBL7101315.1 hypothetical protein [Desulfobacteraceae bacterium]MBL7171256.1 hypothetical protein [Desulfobacteraceae bacterium]
MGQNRKAILIIFLACFLIFGLSLSQAETGENQKKTELLAIGISPILKGNSAVAKEKAIAQALMKGVEDYIVNLLGSQGVVNSFERITEEIIPGAKEEIENFHILAEHQADEKYKVLVRLRVNEGIIREKLRSAGALLTEVPLVKVLFLVSEAEGDNVRYWWKDAEGLQSLSAVELALHKVFQERGFRAINRALSPPDAKQFNDLTSPDLQNEDILKWGRLFSADVVIFGQSKISEKREMSLTMNVLDVSQGIQICQGSTSDWIEEELTDTEQIIGVLQGIVNRLAATLCPCIIRAVTSEYEKIYQLEVTLAGMSRPKQFWRFSDFLREEVIGIKSVVPSKIKGNSISASVEFQGDGKKFINRVLNHQKLPFPLRLEQTDEKAIVFNLD